MGANFEHIKVQRKREDRLTGNIVTFQGSLREIKQTTPGPAMGWQYNLDAGELWIADAEHGAEFKASWQDIAVSKPAWNGSQKRYPMEGEIHFQDADNFMFVVAAKGPEVDALIRDVLYRQKTYRLGRDGFMVREP